MWVATLRSCEVTLTVYASGGPAPLKVAEGVRTTTQIGKNLHILAITASPLGSTALSPGTLYLYDLKFLDMGIAIVSLQEALDRPVDPASPPDFTTDPFTLGYGSLGMPSFSLPPSDPNKIRIMHGSCRRAHGEAGDALTILDDLISATASKPDERPHQLYLTGDQIYADDVADSLLLMLTDAGDTLLGWTETLPSIPPFLPPGPAAKLPPYSREKYLKAVGFTSEDLRSHLMSLGEYLAMYLFAWSDALWPTNSPNPVDTVPTFLDIVGSVHDLGDHDDLVSTIVDRERIIRKDISNLRTFRDSLPQVRKALANIPTYMICDDHEVTNDWNMTREFCEDVYGHDFRSADHAERAEWHSRYARHGATSPISSIQRSRFPRRRISRPARGCFSYLAITKQTRMKSGTSWAYTPHPSSKRMNRRTEPFECSTKGCRCAITS